MASVLLHGGLIALLAIGPTYFMTQGPIEISFVSRNPNGKPAAQGSDNDRPIIKISPPTKRALTSVPSTKLQQPAATQSSSPADSLNTSTEAITDASQAASGNGGEIVNTYAAEVARLLNAQKTYPEVARRMRQQGRVRLQFTLNRDGTVLAVAVLENSPHEILNEAARSLIERIHQFKPFPDDVKAAKMVFTVPLEYTM
jgi:protein TonB